MQRLAFLISLLVLAPFTTAQNAALGGAGNPAASPAPSQYPVVNVGSSLLTIDGKTSAVNGPFTQTFVLPLGTWAFPTPSAGSIGLGDIQGTVGAVKTGH